MKLDEIVPHLNKLATLYLRGNKKKVGWLFMEDHHPSSKHANSKHTVNEVYFVNVQKGKRLIHSLNTDDTNELKTVSESISIHEIVRIRSSK